MNIKAFSFLLLLLTGACTPSPNSSSNREICEWRQTVEQLTALEKKRDLQACINISKQKLPEILQAIEQVEDKDSLINYTLQLLDIYHHSQLHSRQYSEAINYLDSIGRNPILQKYAQYELLSSKAGLNQMMGNNKEAIRLAEEYMKLPPNPNVDRLIEQTEIISGVYVYSGNNFPQAIKIIERAVKLYHKGGKYKNMLRLMSRLGIYYRLTAQYEKAAATNQEAIASYNDSIPPLNIVIAYGEQANLYGELDMYDYALQMNEKAQHYSILNDSFGLGDLYRYRSKIFRELKVKDSVFHYLRLGEKLSALQNSYKGVFVNKVAMVDCYLDYPDSIQKALLLAQSVCPDSSRVPPWAKYELDLHLGRALLKTGQEGKGVALMEQAARGFAEMDMVESEYEVNKMLIEYYQSKNMNDKLVHYYNRNQLFTDSLELNKKLRSVAAANIQFEVEQKQKENRQLSMQLKEQKQQSLCIICILGALFLLLVAVSFYLILRRKANRQQLENNKREIQKLIKHQQTLNQRNEQLTEQIEQATANNNLNAIRQLTGQSLLSKEDENTFRQSFAAVYPSYLPRLREAYPQLTRNEELLAMLICMNHSTDEIALIMGINRNSVNVVRSRMRKNMELSKEESLDEVLKQYL